MKIGAAQINPIKGDIVSNIARHQQLIELAAGEGAECIFFPELSITGYEPELAEDLALDVIDNRLDIFQSISDERNMMISVGMPTKNIPRSSISMIIFRPGQSKLIYSKTFLHASEEEHFSNGADTGTVIAGTGIAPAICYEVSVPEHAEKAFANGAKLYAAGVVESRKAVEKALSRLSLIAKTYSAPTIMANCIGLTGGYDCPGRSSAWNEKGELACQLNEMQEGVLVYDTNSGQAVARYL